MRIIDRYTLKAVVSVFLLCIAGFMFLYVVIDILSYMEDMLKRHTTAALLLKYYLSYLPSIFTQMAPFACLLSVLYAFSRLNHNNEIIAMRAAGLSVPHITRTAVIFGGILSLFVFFVSDRVMPPARLINLEARAQMENPAKKAKEIRAKIVRNVCMYGLKNRLFFISKFIPAENRIEGIIILEHDEHQNLLKKIVANKGVYDGTLWKFHQSITYNFDASGAVIGEPAYYDEEIMAIPETPHDFLTQRQRPDSMNIAQLDDYIWKLSRGGAKTVVRGLKVDYYQRFTAPFTSLVITLLGIPFAFRMRRRAAGLSSIGISILVGFLYYILDAVSIALGKYGVLPPVVAASLSHAVILAWSMLLINALP